MNLRDQRPECVYGVLVRDGRVFVATCDGHPALPGGEFRPLAANRKVELAAHIWDQLGLQVRAIWAQGAFDYQHPSEPRPRFSGFYSVWDWEGDPPPGAGAWLDIDGVAATDGLPASLRILLMTIISTVAIRTR